MHTVKKALLGLSAGYVAYIVVLTIAALAGWGDFGGTSTLQHYLAFLFLPLAMLSLALSGGWMDMSNTVQVMGIAGMCLILSGYAGGLLRAWKLPEHTKPTTFAGRMVAVASFVAIAILLAQVMTSVYEVKKLNATLSSSEMFSDHFVRSLKAGMTREEVARIVTGFRRHKIKGQTYKEHRFVYRFGILKYTPLGSDFGELVVLYDSKGILLSANFE